MSEQEKDEPWRCPYCDGGFPCECQMAAEDMRLAALAQRYLYNPELDMDDEYTDLDMQLTEMIDMPDPYEELDDLYGNAPKFQKIQRSQSPVSDGHNLQRVTENARNRQLKAARKLKDLARNPSTFDET
jgi:hypothetical protein